MPRRSVAGSVPTVQKANAKSYSVSLSGESTVNNTTTIKSYYIVKLRSSTTVLIMKECTGVLP